MSLSLVTNTLGPSRFSNFFHLKIFLGLRGIRSFPKYFKDPNKQKGPHILLDNLVVIDNLSKQRDIASFG